MRDDQTDETQATCPTAGLPLDHSAVRGYPEGRDAGHCPVGSSSGLDGSHVGDTTGRQSESRQRARWPNAYFTKHGFISLNEAHVRFVQSVTGTY